MLLFTDIFIAQWKHDLKLNDKFKKCDNLKNTKIV